MVPKTTVVPPGLPVADKVIGLVKPALKVAVNVVCMEAGAGQLAAAGAGALRVNPAAGAVMVKLASEISKKILPTASTLIRAVVVAPLGIVTDSVPSLVVLAAKTVGKVVPPSVDNEILTLAQLIGAPVVPFTDQVMVWAEPPAQDTLVLGEVTWKGPVVASTVTVISW